MRTFEETMTLYMTKHEPQTIGVNWRAVVIGDPVIS
jgi:hypothetical protein